jgi:putative sigma-54 modulation protein
MKVIITGRRFNVSTNLKAIVDQKLMKIRHFYDHVLMIHVILEKEKMGFKAEVQFNADGRPYCLRDSGASPQEAIDLLVDKLERQIRKHRERVQDRRQAHSIRNEGRSDGGANVRVVDFDPAPRALIDVLRELAVSAEEAAFFAWDENPAVQLAAQKDDEDLYVVIGKDPELGAWVSKRVFLVDNEIDQTVIEDYPMPVLSMNKALVELDRQSNAVLVFQNSDSGRIEALRHDADGGYVMVPMGG